MSNKISLAKIIETHLVEGKMPRTHAKKVAKVIVASVEKQVTSKEGQVSIGSIGKIFSKTYEASQQYNPAKRAKTLRPKYRTVRFRTYKGAKAVL